MVKWVFFSLIFCATAWGYGEQNAEIRAKAISIKVRNAVLKGFHFVNASGRRNPGPPVLFMHGLGLNAWEFDRLIQARMKAGDDCYAFNWRGHGNGEERSIVTNYSDGDYRFEKMVEEDLPSILNRIYKARGQPITIVGHSMGGMIALAVSGSYKSEKIKGIVAIGSPGIGLEKVGPQSVVVRQSISYYLDKRTGDFEVNPIGSLDFFREINKWNPLYPLVERRALALAAPLFREIFIHENFDFYYDRWVAQSVSRRLPLDILKSFRDFQSYGYKYGALEIDVPVLYITGGRDGLAPHDDVIQNAARQRKGDVQALLLVDSGHIDLVADKAVNAYSETLGQFITSSHKKRKTRAVCSSRMSILERW